MKRAAEHQRYCGRVTGQAVWALVHRGPLACARLRKLAGVCAAALAVLASGCLQQPDQDANGSPETSGQAAPSQRQPVPPAAAPRATATDPADQSGRAAAPANPSASSEQATGAESLAEPHPPRDSPGATHSKARAEVVALQKEEVDVARQFLKDFGGGVDGLGLLGSVYLNHGRSAEAVKCWQQCIEKAPNRPEAYDAMASVALQKGQFERVVSLSNKALEIQPHLAGVRNRLARALLGLGKTQAAVDVLEEDVRLFPRSADSDFFLGRAYAQLGQYAKARESYLRALALKPNHLQACYQLALVCQRLERAKEAKQYREKFQALNTAARSNLRGRKGQESERVDLAAVRRGVAATESVAANFYRRHGRPERAEQLWRRAIELDPNNAKAHANVGNVRAQAGQLDAAAQEFRRAIQLAPDRVWGYQGLAKVYLARNIQAAEAKELAQTAVRIAPVASNYVLLARACSQTGDSAGALTAMERAVALAPHNKEYQRIHAMLKQQQ